MRVLVVGGGGREHAIVWRLAANPTVDRILAAPGNAGIGRLATRVPVAADDIPALLDLVERERVDLTVVGPEAPLVEGLADELHARGRLVFGPTRAAARIEGSKAWAKELCERHDVPSGRSRSFTDIDEAIKFLDEFGAPYVVKADGLAAGKGVTVTEDRDAAVAAVRACLQDRVFGRAGSRVVIEEFLEGPEVSAFALTDGRSVLPLGFARDYKRARDGDGGPNTGGMGAHSPVPLVDDVTAARIHEEILVRTLAAMEAEGARYAGLLYAGLVLTPAGPKVLEFNCRFGDPEAQAVLPRLRTDLGELFLACVEGNLSSHRAIWKPEGCVTVVLASGGYPGDHATGVAVVGLAGAAAVPGVTVFHAGTDVRDGRVVTSGGRVLGVSGTGPGVAEARARAYEAVGRISFEAMQYRTDIAANVGE